MTESQFKAKPAGSSEPPTPREHYWPMSDTSELVRVLMENPLLAALSYGAPHELRRSLIVRLGGTGSKIMREVGRMFSPAEIPPETFLLLDTPAKRHPVRDSELRRLRARNNELTLERERLKSQLVAARRAELSARRQTEYLEAHNEGQLRHIGTLAEANRALQAALIAKEAGRVCMHETYSGTVTDREGDEVAVTYETEEGSIEQVYNRAQFLHGRLPSVGDDLEAHVIVTRRPPDSSKVRQGVRDKEQVRDDFPAFREKGVSGPIEI